MKLCLLLISLKLRGSARQVNSLAYKLTNAQQLPKTPTRQLTNSPIHRLTNPQFTNSLSPIHKLTNSPTH